MTAPAVSCIGAWRTSPATRSFSTSRWRSARRFRLAPSRSSRSGRRSVGSPLRHPSGTGPAPAERDVPPRPAEPGDGVPPAAVLELLERLVASGCDLWVRADFDAAGQTVVETIRARVGSITPWRPPRRAVRQLSRRELVDRGRGEERGGPSGLLRTRAAVMPSEEGTPVLIDRPPSQHAVLGGYTGMLR